MVDGSGVGGCGGGSLEHPRQWRVAQWAGLFIGALSCPEPPGAPLRRHTRQAGALPRQHTLTMLRHSHSIHMPFSSRNVTWSAFGVIVCAA